MFANLDNIRFPDRLIVLILVLAVIALLIFILRRR
jgi:hypothetical protein